ncbi:MAG: hypothetical protein QOD32_1362 [Pyrinomonadaceae bacterium]|nr:hypothetical protein [Pyrinomonadaceae bacterium]
MSRRLPDFTRVFSSTPAASFFSTQPVASLFSTHASRTTFKLLLLVSCACLLLSFTDAHAQRKRRAPSVGGQHAVVVDERLAALRDAPQLTATLVQRLGRGRAVSIIGARRVGDGGLNFYHVAVTRRTRGWLQAEAVASPARVGDDEKLLRLIRGSEEFDRLARARIFLEHFTRSPLRPGVLLLFGDGAEAAAAKLTRDAPRRLDEGEMAAGGAPLESYFLNFNELDRYNKQGIKFVFERATKRFRYDGESWREILRRHPRSPEAAQARQRLDALAAKK